MAPKYVPQDVEVVNPEDSPVNSDGFAGVDPIYQNFANDTDAPYYGETKSKVQKGKSHAVVVPADDSEDEEKSSEDDGKGEDKGDGGTTPKAPATPAKATGTTK
jgi:hypothetical protein